MLESLFCPFDLPIGLPDCDNTRPPHDALGLFSADLRLSEILGELGTTLNVRVQDMRAVKTRE
jgi:hypothetical protein